MPRVRFSTKTSGPFFELKGQPLKDAGAAMIQDLLKEGQAKVEAQLTPGHGVATGTYKSSIHQKFVRSSKYAIGWGKLFPEGYLEYPGRKKSTVPAPLIGNLLEGGSRRGDAVRFKGYHVMRKTAAHLRKLLKQLAGKHFARAVKRLT